MTGAPRPSRLWALACALTGGVLALPALAAGAPALSGTDGDAWNTAPTYVVTPDPDASSLTWAATNGEFASIRDPGGPVTVTLQREFREGEHVLTVIQGRGGNAETVARRFTIDRTAPGALRVLGPPAVSSETPFGVSWAGQEAGARFTWSIVAGADPAAAPVRPPVDTVDARADIAGLPAGAFAVRVVQTDRAGNTGPAALFPVTVVPSPVLTPTVTPAAPPATTTPAPAPAATPRAPAVTTLALPSLRTTKLRPRKAAVVRNRRPTLSWTRGPAGTTVYNVQIFRVGTPRAGATSDAVPLRKVRSVFPRAQRMRTPVLARGACYVWRVWPFRGRTFTKAPLGISNFCVAKNARIRR